MKKEVKDLLKIAKKIVRKDIYEKLLEIKEEQELEHALKYSIRFSLEKEADKLKDKVDHLKAKGKDVLFAETKLLLIPSKIKHFEVDYSEGEFYKLESLFNNIKREIDNV